MIYAERQRDDGSTEKGVFLSLFEFIGYRHMGWSATNEINRMADEAIAKSESDPVDDDGGSAARKDT